MSANNNMPEVIWVIEDSTPKPISKRNGRWFETNPQPSDTSYTQTALLEQRIAELERTQSLPFHTHIEGKCNNEQCKAYREMLEQRAKVAAEKIHAVHGNEHPVLKDIECKMCKSITAIIIAVMKGETK